MGVLKSQDMFASDIAFRENRGRSFTTTAGIIVSIFIYTVILIYGGNKLVILKGREDTMLSEYFETNTIGDSVISFKETDFFFAMGFRDQKEGGQIIENIQEYFSISFQQ